MPNLLDIRRRIKSTKNTQQITKAMKLVSASKLRRASEAATGARPYAERIFDVHSSVLKNLNEWDGPLYRKSEGKTLVVVIAADKGLCGSFNANIFKHVTRMIDSEGQDNLKFMTLGRKAVAYFNHLGTSTEAEYSDIFRNVDFTLAETISNQILELFLGGEVSRVVLVYNKFINVLLQEVNEKQLLPLSADDAAAEAPAGDGIEHLAEPGLAPILEELAPEVVKIQLFQALLESAAAEHAARMTAMDAATSNAKDLIDQLTLDMNKARQAAITTELIEVVSGAAAL